MPINKLRSTLTESHEKYLFPCITDLVENGLSLERFGNNKNIPTRQDITQYLAAWFKYAGLSVDECREWMLEYCVEELSAISSSSKSQIRHSTKSNLKFIYNSEVIFDCRCEKNRFKAHCEQACPIYEEMAHLAKTSEMATAVKINDVVSDSVEDSLVPKIYSIKDEHREQFEKAMEFALDHLKKQYSRKQTVTLLNNNGFKTKTGKPWSTSILGLQLRSMHVP